ncbi:MAG TPA: sialidase family protein, partial [Flavisolibacter sp.]|nr:sialidase family protein [Flavisolibacter sp.]
HTVSIDGGETFSKPERISHDNWVIRGCPHTGPAMTENKEGLHFTWFTGGKNAGCYYTKSRDNGKSFAMHDSVSSLGSHPQIASLPGGELVVAWDEAIRAENKINKKIGVQKRTARGESEEKTFITADSEVATYPVVSPVDKNASVIAYTKKKGGKNFIAYQLVRFN